MAFDVMWPTETGLATPQRGVHDQEPGLLLARGLLTFVFFVYLVVVLASAAALAPLSSRAAAASVLLLGAVAAVALTWRTRPRAARHAPAMGESDRAFTVLGTAAAALGGAAMTYAAALALLLPIGAYDALGYRLPAIAQWLDAGAVIWVAGDDPLRNGYPLGLEVVGAAFFRAFDSPAPVDALSVLCVIAGAAALAGFARLCGAGSGPARLAAGLFMLAPVHLLNAAERLRSMQPSRAAWSRCSSRSRVGPRPAEPAARPDSTPASRRRW